MSPADVMRWTVSNQHYMYQAAVIGAGPGGLAAVLSLLDHGVKDIAWIDPTFGGGRLNELYREISSYVWLGIVNLDLAGG